MKNQQQSLFDTPAPAAHDSRTSTEAAKKVTESGRHATIRSRVFAWLHSKHFVSSGDGYTDEEIKGKMPDCRLSSIVSARNSLCNKRPPLVENSGRTRKSRTTGMRATVWRIA